VTDNPYGAAKNFGYTYMPDVLANAGVNVPTDPKKAFYNGVIPELKTTKSWDNMPIDRMAAILAMQHDGQFHGAALAWGKMIDLLNGLKTAMDQAGTGLLDGWNPAKSDAAENFFQHVGASTWSLDDWILWASQNQRAVTDVANAIAEARKQMATIYKNYLNDWNYHIGKANYWTTPAGLKEINDEAYAEGVGGGMPVVSVSEYQKDDIKAANDARTKYTGQAKKVMIALGEAYASNWGAINEGRKFQGPTNAVNPLTTLVNRVNQIISDNRAAAAQAAQAAARLAAQQQAALQALANQRAAQLAAQLAAEQAAEQAAAAQAAAAQAAAQLAAQEAARQAAAQAAVQAGQPGMPFGVPAAFAVSGPGPVGLAEPGAISGTGAAGAGLPGEPEQFGIGGPGGGGAAGRTGNPLLGRSGLNPAGSARPGVPPGRGAGSPLGRRQSEERERDEEEQSARQVRPESEEYLADLPGAGTPRLLGGGPEYAPPTRPVGPRLGGRGPAGPPGQGRPPMGGAPQGRARPGSPEQLTGRRRRSASSEEDDELFATESHGQPDLNGRHGHPVDRPQAGHPVVGSDALLGTQGMQPVVPAQPTGAVRPPAEVPEDETEFWAVEKPAQIQTPIEQQPPDTPHGRVVGGS
jgi:hypothetical protein